MIISQIFFLKRTIKKLKLLKFAIDYCLKNFLTLLFYNFLIRILFYFFSIPIFFNFYNGFSDSFSTFLDQLIIFNEPQETLNYIIILFFKLKS